jgi:type I restriction enzyme R subunit
VAIHPRQRFITADEVAFSDALAANESTVKAMGIPEMKVIVAELVPQACKAVTIDSTAREGARVKIKVMVNRILKKHGFRPDMQDEAIKTVMAQAELLCADWATT